MTVGSPAQHSDQIWQDYVKGKDVKMSINRSEALNRGIVVDWTVTPRSRIARPDIYTAIQEIGAFYNEC